MKNILDNAKNVVILGGGLAGLAAANKLLDKGFNVKIIEGAPFLGGLASSFYMEGEEIPKFNHHIVRHNTKTLEYLKRYKCMGNNTWTKIRVGIAKNGKVFNVNNPFHLLKFPGLSLWGKFRFALFGVYSIFVMNPNRIDDELDLDTWLLKYAGREVKDKIWYQLYGRNKFNISLKKISAKQFAHRLYEKEGYDYFTFPTKGIEKMIDGLASDVKKRKGIIIYPARIKHVDVKNKKVTFQTRDKDKIIDNTVDYDILINTIPVPELIKFTVGLPKRYVDNIKKLRYVPVVGLCFATKEFLDPDIYWINLFGERVHLIYQHSLIIDKYKSKITWCDRYGGSEEDLGKTDEELKELYLADMKKYFPDMKLKWVKVFREKYAEPIYDKDYVKYAPTYESPIPTLFHAGIQVTFPKIRNMNVALESGEIVAEKILKRFNKLPDKV
jgi:protoporphyrinogen oxidase